MRKAIYPSYWNAWLKMPLFSFCCYKGERKSAPVHSVTTPTFRCTFRRSKKICEHPSKPFLSCCQTAGTKGKDCTDNTNLQVQDMSWINWYSILISAKCQLEKVSKFRFRHGNTLRLRNPQYPVGGRAESFGFVRMCPFFCRDVMHGFNAKTIPTLDAANGLFHWNAFVKLAAVLLSIA